MKKQLWIFLVPVLLATYSCQSQTAIELEKKALIAVNEKERNAYFDRDLAGLEAIWVQEPTSQRFFSSRILDGWKQIRANYEEEIIDNERWELMDDMSASFSNYAVNIYGNTALVYHDIHWSGRFNDLPINDKQKRIVHFIKEDGSWKIDLIVQLPVPFDWPVEEITVRPGDNK